MKNISRRDFLKGVVATAGAAAATSLLGACTTESSASAAASASGIYTPGTYTAEAQGIGTVKMTATFDANSITAIELDVSGETENIGQAAKDELISQIMDKQSSEIDGVSGATVTTDAVKECLDNCIAQAKGSEVTPAESTVTDTDWMEKPEEVTDFAAEYDTEVVVCGHGYAGITSCRELAEQGHSVILIEKSAEDSYQAIGNEFAALNAAILQERGVPHVDPIEFYQNFMLNTGNMANQALIMKFAQNSEANTNWYLSELTDEDFATMTTAYFPEADGQLRNVGALKFWPSVCSFYGDCNQTKIQGYNRQKAIDAGAQIMFGTSAYYVLMEDGKAVGVVAKNDEGYIKINAKAVILATGGFGSNESMMKYFMKDIAGAMIEKNGDALTAMMDHDGQGIRMAYWAGGHLETFGVAGMNMKHYSPSASVQATMPQALWLDHNGNRFCNEFYGTIEHRGRATLFMNRDAFYVCFDKNFPDYRCHLVPQHGAWSPLNGNYESFKEELETAYAKYKGTYEEPEATEEAEGGEQGGSQQQAAEYIIGDTIEELAANLQEKYELTDTQKQNIIDSITRYNSMCDAGADSDFGRDSAVLFPVKEGPFYCVRTTPTIGSTMVTMGGILTDGEQNVIDANMEPIPGLYCSGNVCGRRFPVEYFTPIPGVSLALAIVLGRECGKSVAKFLDNN